MTALHPCVSTLYSPAVARHALVVALRVFAVALHMFESPLHSPAVVRIPSVAAHHPLTVASRLQVVTPPLSEINLPGYG